MLIKDTEQLQKDKFFYEVETDNERIRQALHQYDSAVLIGKDNDPTNIQHRMGRGMSSEDLKTKLESLSYYVKVEPHPTNEKMYVVYSIKNNTKRYVAAFEKGIVPERTLMNTREIEDVDSSTLNPSWTPKKIDNTVKDINGIIQIDESGPRPGLTKFIIPWNIIKMGYRTILLRLLNENLVSITKIEQTFESDNTPEWAAKTGKQSKTLARF